MLQPDILSINLSYFDDSTKAESYQFSLDVGFTETALYCLSFSTSCRIILKRTTIGNA